MMGSEDGELFIKQLASFVCTHEKALANAVHLNRRPATARHAHSLSTSSVRDGQRISPTLPSPPTLGSTLLAASSIAAALGSLRLSSSASSSASEAKLSLTPHHLFYLLSRFEDMSVPVGPMRVRLENLHDASASPNYVSFLSDGANRSGSRASVAISDVGSIHSVSSVRSIMSGMSSLWASFGLGAGIAAARNARSERARAALQADLRYLYSAFTKVPYLRLTPDHRARLIRGYEEFPFDSAVPLYAFKNLQVLEISAVDFRQFFGWDRLADQLRSLTLRRACVDNPADVLIDIVLDDMDRRRRRTSKSHPSPHHDQPVRQQQHLRRSHSGFQPQTSQPADVDHRDYLPRDCLPRRHPHPSLRKTFSAPSSPDIHCSPLAQLRLDTSATALTAHPTAEDAVRAARAVRGGPRLVTSQMGAAASHAPLDCHIDGTSLHEHTLDPNLNPRAATIVACAALPASLSSPPHSTATTQLPDPLQTGRHRQHESPRPRARSTSPPYPNGSGYGSRPRSSRGSHQTVHRSGSGSSQSSLSDSWCGTFHARGSSSNLLASLLPPSKWRFLRHLSLADNSITFITAAGLAPLVDTLQSLDLSHNLLAEMPDSLASLTALRALNLSHCMIDSLHSLARNPLPAISALNLRANRLQSIAGIERLPSLERLDLRDNRLSDPSELARLTAIPDMREVWVDGNPFTRTHRRSYRVTIFNLFRATPGYSDDIILDGAAPSYSERRQLIDRVPVPPAVPFVRAPAPVYPIPVDVDTTVARPAVIHSSPPPLSSPPPCLRERSSPGRDRPRSYVRAVVTEVHISSPRRRKAGLKRRVVEISSPTVNVCAPGVDCYPSLSASTRPAAVACTAASVSFLAASPVTTSVTSPVASFAASPIASPIAAPNAAPVTSSAASPVTSPIMSPASFCPVSPTALSIMSPMSQYSIPSASSPLVEHDDGEPNYIVSSQFVPVHVPGHPIPIAEMVDAASSARFTINTSSSIPLTNEPAIIMAQPLPSFAHGAEVKQMVIGATRQTTESPPSLFASHEGAREWKEPSDWDLTGELYRREIETLRQKVGSGYLSVLGDRGTLVSPDFGSALVATPMRPAIHSGRSVG